MAVSIFDSAEVGASLSLKSPQHLDPKTSVQSISDLEALRPYLPPYSLVIVEDDGTLWQMQPSEEEGWLEFSSGSSGAIIDDSVISTSEVYSSSKIDNTFAKISNVYDKTSSDEKFGLLSQQKNNVNDINILKKKVNALSNAIIYKGNVSTKGDLLLIDDMSAGHLWIVESDESMTDYEIFPSTTYIYNGTDWIFNGIRDFKVRNFETEPIVLGEEKVNEDGSVSWFTEVTGKLNVNNLDLGELNASDIHYQNAGYSSMSTVEDALNELLYTPLSISFSTTASKTLEKGYTVVSPVFNWSYNKKVVSQSIDNVAIDDLDARTYTYPDNITTNKTITLTANDGKSNFTSRISFAFYDATYCGSSAIGDYNEEFIEQLSQKSLKGSVKGSYTVNCKANEYIYFAFPMAIGGSLTTDSFVVGGFNGGFEQVSTVTVENQYGVQCNYIIFKSNNHSLGDTKIEIK